MTDTRPEFNGLINKDSRYAKVMAIARRARQIMREAKSKGVPFYDVSLLKSGSNKPIKLAEEEFIHNMIGFKFRDENTTEAAENNIAAGQNTEQNEAAGENMDVLE